MTEKSLRDVLEDAESAIDTYRHPDLSEAQPRLNEILVAAGLGDTGSDRITKLRVGAKSVYVETAYSVRGCMCDDSFEFPVELIDTDDPPRAAARWGLERKRAEAVREVAQAKRVLAGWETELAGIEAKLAAVA